MTERNEFLRGPKWRTQTSAGRRRSAAVLTFAGIVATGVVPMGVAIWFLARVGAPQWLVWLPWVAPTAGAIGWASRRPTPAIATDDDDDSWPGYAIRWVLVGEDRPRRAAARIAAALLFGAPAVWAVGISLLGLLLGIG